MLHALTSILRRSQYQQANSYPLLETVYELVGRLVWEDEFEEKDLLLASFAFLAWNCARRYRSYPETQYWEGKILEHVRAQTPVRDFLALEQSALSSSTLGRFLIDPGVLLVVWRGMDLRVNWTPESALRSSSAIWSWVTSHRTDIVCDEETLAYIEGRLALTAVMASAHLGRGKDWEIWFSRAKVSLSSVQGADPYVAILEYNRIGRLYITHQYSEVNERIGALIDQFRSLSMPAHELKAKFVKANTLKDGGYPSALALRVSSEAYREAVLTGNLLMSANLACCIAQIHGKAGRQSLADCYATIGARLAKRASCPWVVAYAISTWGELLRDRGAYLEAIEAYRAAAKEYEKSGMHPFVAYIRVLTAETLLLEGNEEEAIGELLTALPIIEYEGLIGEAEASIWLMRQAIAQKRLRPGMLKELRERLAPAR